MSRAVLRNKQSVEVMQLNVARFVGASDAALEDGLPSGGYLLTAGAHRAGEVAKLDGSEWQLWENDSPEKIPPIRADDGGHGARGPGRRAAE